MKTRDNFTIEVELSLVFSWKSLHWRNLRNSNIEVMKEKIAMNKNKRAHTLKIILYTLLMGMIFTLVKTSSIPYSQAGEVKSINNHMISIKHTNHKSANDLKYLSEKQKKQKSAVSHDEIVAIMDQFIETLVQDVNDDYKVLNFKDADDLLTAFETISTIEVAQVYVDFYYEETDDGLYIIPTETPPWFVAENPYDVVQLKEDQVKIMQTNESDFYGTYTIEVELTYHNNWKIIDITHL